jgi:ABC-type phosphate/phosphonate transport system substrate-binding protein
MSGRVALPMYGAPADAVEAFWQNLHRHLQSNGLDPDPALSSPDDLDAHWRDPDLLLSQTCGFPLTTSLAGHVAYVGTPCYRAPGCTGSLYSSAVVVRTDDASAGLRHLRGCRVAFNSRDSQSGYNSLRALVAPLAAGGRFFTAATETGAHRSSVAAVRTGRADLAAIDAVTWALLERDEPDQVAGLRVLCYTAPAPGLPFVTAAGTDAARLERIRAALAAACSDPASTAARADLLIDGFEVLPIAAYDAIPAMRDQAIAAGYPELA